MATVRPFRGLRFDPALAGPLNACLAPPYDVISHELRERLLALGPYNIVHVDFAPDRPGDDARENRYTRAAATYRAWRQTGVLARETAPALYVTESDFPPPHEEDAGGRVLTRRGLLAAVRLVSFDAGVILPHERTLSGPKADRLALMEATTAALSPIFSLYRDPDGAVAALLARAAARPPDAEATDPDGVRHRLRVVTDLALTEAVAAAFEGRRLYIGDGHHRYETALAYHERHPELPSAGYVPMTLTALEDTAIVILPTHRVLRGVAPLDLETVARRLAPRFRVAPAEGPLAALLAGLAEAGRRGPAFLAATAAGGGAPGLRFARLEWSDPAALAARSPRNRLDVALLEQEVLEGVFGLTAESITKQEHLAYVKDPAEALWLVEVGEASHAFLLNGTKPAEVVAVAEAGETMPQKSTFFYPKLPTGLVVLPLDEPLA
jgi:uncharacterized protein (DUF1015 family)